MIFGNPNRREAGQPRHSDGLARAVVEVRREMFSVRSHTIPRMTLRTVERAIMLVAPVSTPSTVALASSVDPSSRTDDGGCV
jgi:hypothetical protein